jgi:spore maturation protein CgeB
MIVGPLARAELMQVCGQHDVGLALMPLASDDLNVRSMTGASNKPFDYLACGLALLVSQLPDWEEMFVRPGYGLSCDPSSVQSLTGAIGWLCAHPQERHSMGERGRHRILEEWNYDHQFQPVLELLSKTNWREMSESSSRIAVSAGKVPTK